MRERDREAERERGGEREGECERGADKKGKPKRRGLDQARREASVARARERAGRIDDRLTKTEGKGERGREREKEKERERERETNAIESGASATPRGASAWLNFLLNYYFNRKDERR
jgi:hypothetical protein